MIHVYFGTGKGKTTSAIGLAVRAAGRGKRVYVGHFIKDYDLGSGEDIALRKLDLDITVECYSGQKHPIFSSKDKFDENNTKKLIAEAFDKIEKFVLNKKYDLIVLDELLNAESAGLIDKERIIALIKKISDLELVLTGRKCDNDIIEIADYVSCIEDLKHPFKNGILAREGIEF